ncbi:hypothetical protein SmJEL517_g05527 [Synchytrium microbalum]|uniref:AMP-dependent synthetase/ligase domain-containing protein n=1 Tax=Synchytrium microbalum TaxID=1806994 RepID=A0A507BKX3_9FUNG|nr:uncharacterized protein SmJEL517_g05527 [Synchytrium microbalum]TPX31080.1 hypothetical protein SmJEL517_g05527 [Synchytrium microbalum]
MALAIPQKFKPGTAHWEAPGIINKTVSPKKDITANPKTDPIEYLDQWLGLSADLDVLERQQPGMAETVQVSLAQSGNWTTVVWEPMVKAFPDKEAFVFAEDGRSWTYRQLDEDSNRWGNYLLKMGVKPKQIVPLMVENSPEYVIAMLGIVKYVPNPPKTLRVNFNLRSNALLHCLKVATGDVIVFGDNMSEHVKDVSSGLSARMICFGNQAAGDWASNMSIAQLREQYPATQIPYEIRSAAVPADLMLFIYTSGTTGLPKPVTILHGATIGAGVFIAAWGRYRNSDRIYTPLPLYHSAGGAMALLAGFRMGMTVIVQRKLSARNYFKDCAKYNATYCQYIGEVARYLLAIPPDPSDRAHNVRAAIGNGLRPDCWLQFQERFGIKEINEFYGATDGLGGISHHCTSPDTAGSIGQLGVLMRLLQTSRIIKFDYDGEKPVRTADGLCVEADVNEPGEFINEVDAAKGRVFVGYHNNNEATEKKLLRDVFKKGDCWHRSGDILRQDARGFFYFVDRIGDTFRWKGENCSTNEIGDLLDQFPGIVESNVYGAEVPNMDGRAGMAALVVDEKFDMAALGKYVAKELPKYAVPLWIRIRSSQNFELTGTYKLVKTGLRAEGIDIRKYQDKVYMFDDKTNTYKPFGVKEYNDVVGGKVKL